jgi:uncharacterized protein (DUF433 family)
MNWSGCDLVEMIPGKVSGTPLLKGTRVPVDQILASLDAGESAEEIAYNYDLKVSDVHELEAYLQKYRAA